VGELTDELRFFLSGRRYAVLATHDPNGRIHLTPIWFVFDNDRFYFASSSTSRKVKYVEANATASVVVDAREPGRERWVSAAGLVQILRDREAQSMTPASDADTSLPKRSTARSKLRSAPLTTSHFA